MTAFDSLKTAGTSAAEVAKIFGGRLSQEHQAKAHTFTGKDASFLSRATAIAGAVVAAAHEAYTSPEFDKARVDVTTAFAESRDGLQGVLDTVTKGRVTLPGAGAAGRAGTDVPYIDGEIVDEAK